jgi:hypothetical protein
VSTLKYPGIVRAARNIGVEKKALAEQLYLEIPPVGKGRRPGGTKTVEQQLREAAEEIERETGEKYETATLDYCRKVAMWVAGSPPGFASTSSPADSPRKRLVHEPFPWADASWTAHQEAYGNGLSWADFVAGKRTKRAVRQQAGASTGDVPAAAKAINAKPAEAAKLVSGLTDEAKAKLSAELAPADQASAVTAALDDEQVLTNVIKSMNNDQRTKVYRQINLRTRELFEEMKGKEVERPPQMAAVAKMKTAHTEVTEKLHTAGNLLAAVNRVWSDYEGSFSIPLVTSLLDKIRLELSIVEFYAGYDPDKRGAENQESGSEGQGSEQ